MRPIARERDGKLSGRRICRSLEDLPNPCLTLLPVLFLLMLLFQVQVLMKVRGPRQVRLKMRGEVKNTVPTSSSLPCKAASQR